MNAGAYSASLACRARSCRKCSAAPQACKDRGPGLYHPGPLDATRLAGSPLQEHDLPLTLPRPGVHSVEVHARGDPPAVVVRGVPHGLVFRRNVHRREHGRPAFLPCRESRLRSHPLSYVSLRCLPVSSPHTGLAPRPNPSAPLAPQPSRMAIHLTYALGRNLSTPEFRDAHVPQTHAPPLLSTRALCHNSC